MSAGPPPWSRSGQEPETTPDGRRIRRDPRFGAFVEDEPGKWCLYVTAEEQEARIERFLRGEPKRRQWRASLDWNVWRS